MKLKKRPGPMGAVEPIKKLLLMVQLLQLKYEKQARRRMIQTNTDTLITPNSLRS
jgi:hypothetical protein